MTVLPNSYLAAGSSDRTIQIWNVTQSRPVYNLTDTDGVRALVVINNQYLASSSDSGIVTLRSLSSFALVKSWSASFTEILSLAFDSTLNALVTSDKNNVRVWDPSLLL